MQDYCHCIDQTLHFENSKQDGDIFFKTYTTNNTYFTRDAQPPLLFSTICLQDSKTSTLTPFPYHHYSIIVVLEVIHGQLSTNRYITHKSAPPRMG